MREYKPLSFKNYYRVLSRVSPSPLPPSNHHIGMSLSYLLWQPQILFRPYLLEPEKGLSPHPTHACPVLPWFALSANGNTFVFLFKISFHFDRKKIWMKFITYWETFISCSWNTTFGFVLLKNKSFFLGGGRWEQFIFNMKYSYREIFLSEVLSKEENNI